MTHDANDAKMCGRPRNTWRRRNERAAIMSTGTIRVGVGGWIFEPWRETFYPPKLPKVQELAYASRHLTTIEINGTFYRTQNPQTFRKWAGETPDGFVFSVKANRFAVNRKDLATAGESITRFCESGITALGDKLGPILWQLAGTKTYHAEEIEGFLALLPKTQDGIRLRHVLEPRHPSFRTPEFVAIARRHGVAIVLALSDDYPLIADPTADFCYLRLQTTSAEEPAGYDAPTLETWKARLDDLAAGRPARDLPLLGPAPDAKPRDCFVYMISGAKEKNPAAAQALLAALGIKVAPA
jgi:uncharacterized protein YecE (DUF72 family)